MHSPFLAFARLAALAGAWFVCSPGAALWAQAEQGPRTMLSLTEKDHDRTVDLRVGDTVRVTLPENASTGYRWAVERSDAEVLEALEPEPHYPATAVGSGGEVAFAFRGRKAGIGEILLKRSRPWEGDASVTGRFRLRVQVQP